MTKNSITLNRTLFLADNLPILRGLDSESIDLIATDPPFNKGVGAFEGTTKAGVDVEYKDTWHWEDVQEKWVMDIEGDHPRLYNVIRAANSAAGDDMGAFLCWMGVRVLEMHRVLKPTGSIYLHCDPTASHYLKAMLDAIFGRKNFRNEIVWGYRGGGVPKTAFARKHDIILSYAKNIDIAPFNRQFTEYSDASRKLVKSRGGVSIDNKVRDLDRGAAMPDWWVDINSLQTWSPERTGYPTQKPLALYARIIKASSNPSDMVLDPFAGCATTCVAAEQLERQWIGIDINEKAGAVILERLQNEVSASMAWNDVVRTPTEAPKRTEGGDQVAPELVVVGRRKSARHIPIREVREELIVRDGQRCQGCGWEAPYDDYLQVDNKKPRSLGGEDDMDNLTLLCDPCNRMKSNKLTLHELRMARADEGRIDADWYEEEKRK